MCTLSVIALKPHGGIRLVINRDESVLRPAALPPQWHDLAGGVRAIWPVDPLGGGTWVAANEHGMAFAILNRNLEPPPALPQGLTSRGLIIPRLAGSDSIETVLRALGGLRVEQFAPFRLVAVDAGGEGRGGSGTLPRAVVFSWDLVELAVDFCVHPPLCLASSGLGDGRAQSRIPLFASMVCGSAEPAAQDAFHNHTWPGEEAVSVMMSRPGYRTVSVTSADLRPATGRRGCEVLMHYREIRGELEGGMALSGG